MTPREIDALVAEKVMGLGKGWEMHRNFSPSTSMDAAMEVVQRFIGPPRFNYSEHGRFGFDMSYMGNGDDYEWEVHIQGSDRISYTRHAATLPMAICLAAIAAVKAKETK